MKIRPVGAELWTDGRTYDRQTDMTKLIVTLRNFANALKDGKDKILGRIIAGIPRIQTALIFCIHQLRFKRFFRII
jgi:hypothetical protein